MKVGRNMPCPCGSGAKWKRCCGRDRVQRVIAPAGSTGTLLKPYLESACTDVATAMGGEIRATIRTSRDTPAWRDARFDTDRLEHRLHIIRDRFRAIVTETGHDRHYWFIVVRVLAYDLFEIIRGLEKQQTNEILRDALASLTELVFCCDVSDVPADWVEDEGARGMGIEPSTEIVVTAGRLAALAYLHFNTEVAYRYAAKGMPMRALEAGEQVLDHQLIQSVDDFEWRKQRFITITGDAGFWYDAGAFFPLNADLAQLWYATHANSGHTVTIASLDPPVTLSGPYFPLPLTESRHLTRVDFSRHTSLLAADLGKRGTCLVRVPYDALLEHFAATIEAAFHVPAPRLTSFLYAVFSFVGVVTGLTWLEPTDDLPQFEWPDAITPSSRTLRLHHVGDALQLGLIRSSRDQWLLGIADAAAAVSADDANVHRLTTDETAELFDRFTFQGPASRRRREEPYLFSALSGKTVYFDFLGTQRFIHDLFASTNVIETRTKGAPARRGAFFEKQVCSFLTRELDLNPRKIVADVTTQRREIDIAFVYKRVLFVIECKSYLKDASDIAGKHSKVVGRLEKFAQELEEKLPQRIDEIRRGFTSNTIKPTEFDRAVGLVCTAAVEYLPKDDPRLWQDSRALVGTPEELLETIHALSIA